MLFDNGETVKITVMGDARPLTDGSITEFSGTLSYISPGQLKDILLRM